MNIPIIFLIKREVLNSFVIACEDKALNPDDIVNDFLEKKFYKGEMKKKSDLESIKQAIEEPKPEPKKDIAELANDLGKLNNRKMEMEEQGKTSTPDYADVLKRIEAIKKELLEA